MTRGSLLVDVAPADCWEDGFPVGNGRHGALVHGRPGAERVVVTHHHLTWRDAPAAPGYSVPPDLAGRLPRVRDLLLAGESGRALELFAGDWPGYHPRPFHPALAIAVRQDAPSPAREATAPGATARGYAAPGDAPCGAVLEGVPDSQLGSLG